MNGKLRFYGPEKFESVISALTTNPQKDHPESYYLFIRKAINVCTMIKDVEARIDDFNLNREFLEKFGNPKGDIVLDDFLGDLYMYANNEETKRLVQNFVLHYFNLCKFIDDLNESDFTFKERSFINDKFNKLLIMIIDMCDKFACRAKDIAENL